MKIDLIMYAFSDRILIGAICKIWQGSDTVGDCSHEQIV